MLDARYPAEAGPTITAAEVPPAPALVPCEGFVVTDWATEMSRGVLDSRCGGDALRFPMPPDAPDDARLTMGELFAAWALACADSGLPLAPVIVLEAWRQVNVMRAGQMAPVSRYYTTPSLN
jgi:hypothetical protein